MRTHARHITHTHTQSLSFLFVIVYTGSYYRIPIHGNLVLNLDRLYIKRYSFAIVG
jgi:hypothetical protein